MENINKIINSIFSLEVSNFRGFSSKKTIEFSSIDSGKNSGLNIIVGENSSGKTTILEIIKEGLAAYYQNKDTIIINDTVFNNKEKHIKITIKTNGPKITMESNEKKNIINISSNVDLLDYSSEPLIINISSKKMKGSNVLSESYETPDMFITRQYAKERIVRSEMNDFLSLLFSIEKNKESSEKFNDILRKFLPNVSFKITATSENEYGYLIIFTDEIGSTLVEGTGDGLITILYIACGIFILENYEKSKILIIDEPEVSLHPQLIKRVGEVLFEYSKKYQIFISTHSPYMINWSMISNGASLIRTVKGKKGLEVYSLDHVLLDGSVISKSHPHTFGINANEVFFLRDKIILLEGQEDVICYKAILNKLNIDENKYDFYGWGANGTDNMKTIANILKCLGYKKVVMILDGDSAGKKVANKYKTEYPEFLIMNIGVDDIRDKEKYLKRKDGFFNEKKIFGVCNKKYKVKPCFEEKYKKEFTDLFNEIDDYFVS